MPAGEIRIVGRADHGDPEGPRFSWSGTTVVARFSGTSVGVRLRDAGNWFEVVLDGGRLAPLVTAPGRERYALAAGLAPGQHEIALHRRTEASFGETQLLGLVLDPDGALLPPPPPAPRRLEVVGDSITCGYGVEADGPSVPFSAATENHALTFAALTTRALDAEAITVAWSGKGMYRNYDGARHETIPTLYDRVLAGRPLPLWDFTSWVPDAVIINLGTNDFGPGDPGPGFGEAYRAFVRQVRGHYPRALILCTFGPVMSRDQVDRARAYLAPTLEQAGIDVLEFPRQDGSIGYGSDWHPSAETHRRMADQLTAELRRRLSW
jgi:lysophospholipase L1-like esterase